MRTWHGRPMCSSGMSMGTGSDYKTSFSVIRIIAEKFVSLQKSKRMMYTRKEQMEAFGRFLDWDEAKKKACDITRVLFQYPLE